MIMTVRIKNKSVVVGPEIIPLSDFPILVRNHLSKYPKTLCLEEDGHNLINSNFNEKKLIEFIRGVCKWGGYAGIATRVIKRNSISNIQNTFRNAVNELEQDIFDVREV